MSIGMSLLETHLYPCKHCYQIENHRKEIECLILTLGNDIYDSFIKIIIGIYHVLVHVTEEDGKMILWMQDNEVLEKLKVINEEILTRYDRGKKVHEVIIAVIQKK